MGTINSLDLYNSSASCATANQTRLFTLLHCFRTERTLADLWFDMNPRQPPRFRRSHSTTTHSTATHFPHQLEMTRVQTRFIYFLNKKYTIFFL